MPQRTHNAPTADSGDPDLNLLALIACVASVSSFLFYYRQADVLLYGDAIAHINIARRVFDSKPLAYCSWVQSGFLYRTC